MKQDQNKPSVSTRVERDTMGELAVPTEAYYGNFPISSLRMPRSVIRAMIMTTNGSRRWMLRGDWIQCEGFVHSLSGRAGRLTQGFGVSSQPAKSETVTPSAF